MIYWYKQERFLNNMKPKQEHTAQREFFYITLSFFILVAAWLGFNLYHVHVASTISQDLQMQIIPIAPSFDTLVIQNLKTRTQVAPLDSFPNNPATTASPGAVQPSIQPSIQRVGL